MFENTNLINAQTPAQHEGPKSSRTLNAPGFGNAGFRFFIILHF